MPAGNIVIPLEPSSLYISTQASQVGPGKYHWAIFVTDVDGNTTKYHWVQRRKRSADEPAEGVKSYPIRSVKTYSTGNVMTYAFFKLNGYNAVDSETMVQLAQTAFPPNIQYGYPTVEENRAHQISCRTWTLSLLQRMQALGVVQRNDTWDYYQDTINNTTAMLEQQAQAGNFRQSMVYQI